MSVMFANSLLGRTWVSKLMGAKLVKDQNQESSLGFLFDKLFFPRAHLRIIIGPL